MYARIAKFEGDPDRIDEAIDAARKQAEANWDSPPEGLESAKELWMLLDRENAGRPRHHGVRDRGRHASSRCGAERDVAGGPRWTPHERGLLRGGPAQAARLVDASRSELQ